MRSRWVYPASTVFIIIIIIGVGEGVGEGVAEAELQEDWEQLTASPLLKIPPGPAAKEVPRA